MKNKSRFHFHVWYEDFFTSHTPTKLHLFKYTSEIYDHNGILTDLNVFTLRVRQLTVNDIDQTFGNVQIICKQHIFNKVIKSISKI